MIEKGKKYEFPPQHQERMPGVEEQMHPRPLVKAEWYKGSGKLQDKVAIITGGDSGIGRAVAILFAREGADVAIVYLDEHEDAETTKRMVEEEGRACLTFDGDVGISQFCKEVVERVVEKFGRLDILVNNAAWQPYQDDIQSISDEQIERTFRTNIFAYFYMSREAVKHMKKGSAIINTTSVTAYRGSSHLLDYSTTKGAIVAFTRSLSTMLIEKGIRVNGVAPGPIWTPLTPSTFPAEAAQSFGKATAMGRAGQPEEVSPTYVFLAARDSSYITGQIVHPNGGELVNA